jgi:hypothetical protein
MSRRPYVGYADVSSATRQYQEFTFLQRWYLLLFPDLIHLYSCPGYTVLTPAQKPSRPRSASKTPSQNDKPVNSRSSPPTPPLRPRPPYLRSHSRRASPTSLPTARSGCNAKEYPLLPLARPSRDRVGGTEAMEAAEEEEAEEEEGGRKRRTKRSSHQRKLV